MRFFLYSHKSTLNIFYYKNNNSIKYQKGSMNMSEDITMKANIKQNYQNKIYFMIYYIHSDKILKFKKR